MGHFLKRSINLLVWLIAILCLLMVAVFIKRDANLQWLDFIWVRTFLKGGLSLYLVFVGFFIFYENKNPHKTIAWLLVLIAFPVLGFVLYLMFGRSFRKRKISEAKRLFSHNLLEKRADVQSAMVPIIETFNRHLVNERLVNLLLSNSKSPFFLHNEVRIFSGGDVFFDALIEDIRNAKYHIHLEYYIIRDDAVGNALKEALIERARAGLEVRLIYDSVGCWRLGKSYINQLKEAGVGCYAFLPMAFPLLGRELNYRNHRKLTIIDGAIGYIGGMNIGDEYRGKHPYLGYWRDTHLRLVGEGVMGLQHHFLMDWTFVSNELLLESEYLALLPIENESLIQIAASGPDTDWEIISQAYFTMIATAKSRIWIATPYLVPDESIMVGLQTAALSGVDVRIMIPDKPDHLMVHWATRANLERLLSSGVKIFLYKKGFVHAKTLIIDGSVASVGTANLDYRSLAINFEINAFLYGEEEITRLSEDFLLDMESSEVVDYAVYKMRPKWHKVLEAIGRIVSPLQ